MAGSADIKSLARIILPAGGYRSLQRLAARFRKVRFFFRLSADHLRDARRFFRWAHTGQRDRERDQKENAIAKFYHGFEKGLSLQDPRPGFGQEKARILTQKIDEFESSFPATPLTSAARAALQHYANFNRDYGVDLPWLDAWLKRAPQCKASGEGGTVAITREEIIATVSATSEAFFFSRHSVRNFAPGDVPLTDIEKAVRIAQKSPSVCNRQGVRVHCCMQAMDALKWQPGNRGFGNLASRGLVVTADLQAFCSEGERHQAYVDGGLFAMSLVYGLHSMGYGTCMLAWSKRPKEEAGVRRALGISESEVIIMMIAVGCLPEELEVARSQRRPLSQVLQIHS